MQEIQNLSFFAILGEIYSSTASFKFASSFSLIGFKMNLVLCSSNKACTFRNQIFIIFVVFFLCHMNKACFLLEYFALCV